VVPISKHRSVLTTMLHRETPSLEKRTAYNT
jgi:hypothetical protein